MSTRTLRTKLPMRLFIVCVGIAGTQAVTAANTGGFPNTLVFSDGTYFSAAVNEPFLTFRTANGVLRPPIRDVWEVDCVPEAGKDVLILRTGARHSGDFATDTLSVETHWGRSRIPCASLRHILSTVDAALGPGLAADLPFDGLVAYYPFDLDEGDTAKDHSGHGRDARLIGARRSPVGAIALGVTLDTPESRIELPPMPELQSHPFTITAWIRLSHPRPRTKRVLFSNWREARTREGFELATGTEGLTVGVSSTGDAVRHGSGTMLPTNQWFFLAYAQSESAGHLTLSGGGRGSFGYGLPSRPRPTTHRTSSRPLQIGGMTNVQAEGVCHIDEVRIYSRILATNESAALASAGPFARRPPLAARSAAKPLPVTLYTKAGEKINGTGRWTTVLLDAPSVGSIQVPWMTVSAVYFQATNAAGPGVYFPHGEYLRGTLRADSLMTTVRNAPRLIKTDTLQSVRTTDSLGIGANR